MQVQTEGILDAIQRLMGFSVCVSYGRMTGRGMLTACETDVLGALSMLVCHRAALGETVPSGPLKIVSTDAGVVAQSGSAPPFSSVLHNCSNTRMDFS